MRDWLSFECGSEAEFWSITPRTFRLHMSARRDRSIREYNDRTRQALQTASFCLQLWTGTKINEEKIFIRDEKTGEQSDEIKAANLMINIRLADRHLPAKTWAEWNAERR